jgi:hypothetical protein
VKFNISSYCIVNYQIYLFKKIPECARNGEKRSKHIFLRASPKSMVLSLMRTTSHGTASMSSVVPKNACLIPPSNTCRGLILGIAPGTRTSTSLNNTGCDGRLYLFQLQITKDLSRRLDRTNPLQSMAFHILDPPSIHPIIYCSVDTIYAVLSSAIIYSIYTKNLFIKNFTFVGWQKSWQSYGVPLGAGIDKFRENRKKQTVQIRHHTWKTIK